MPVQDLTPQLRTRLNRLEKLVGVFVTLATLLLLTGLGYYLHHTAQRKGWFLTKAPYFVYLHSGVGLNVGDSVKLMGFDVGQITEVTAAQPFQYDDEGRMVDVYVKFVVRYPFYGYVWSDSVVKVKSAGLLGSRFLEVTKGGTTSTNCVYKESKTHVLTEMLVRSTPQKPVPPGTYKPMTKADVYWLDVDEPPELSAQMDEMLRSVKSTLPGVLEMTNQLQRILNNANLAVLNLNALLVGAQPVVTNLNEAMTNLTLLTGTLNTTRGALGDMLLPTNIQKELVLLLPNVNSTVTNVNTNLVSVVSNLNQSLENLAGITSNLHHQVEVNTNMLSEISTLIINTDDMIQGLKRHWLLRSAFKAKATNASPTRPPAQSPKGASQK